MRPSRPSLASFLLLLAMVCPATGQSQVAPANLTSLTGCGSSNTPFGTGGPVRAQFTYEAAEIGVTGPLTIRSLQFRAEESRLLAAKGGILLPLETSTPGLTNATFTSTFATNRG